MSMTNKIVRTTYIFRNIFFKPNNIYTIKNYIYIYIIKIYLKTPDKNVRSRSANFFNVILYSSRILFFVCIDVFWQVCDLGVVYLKNYQIFYVYCFPFRLY